MKKSVLFLLAIFASAVVLFAEEDTTAITKPECTFKVANVAITIDGVDDDAVWQAVDAVDYLGYTPPAEGATDPSADDISFSFKGAWDETGIYLLVDVKDDALVRHLQEEEQSADRWMTDCVEYFFNPGGKRDTAAAGTNYAKATQCRINVGDEELDTAFIGGRFIGSWSDIQDPTGETFQWMVDYPSGGYMVEFWLSWDAILPEDMTLPARWGFTINVGDSDDAEVERENIALWAGAGKSDGQWNDVNYFGVLHLSDEVAVGIDQAEVSSFNVYPNPATDVLRIDGATEVSIFNITGQLVKTANVLNGAVDVADLASGVYVVKSGAYATQVVIK